MPADWRNKDNEAHVYEKDGSRRCTPCGGTMREIVRPWTSEEGDGRYDLIQFVFS
jgi:hypothetical protein